jgi:tripartite ATP-independent transporter DctP family solute receptor
MTKPSTIAVLGLATALLLTGEAGAETVSFTFASTNGPKDVSSRAMVRWQEAMAERSNGDLDMEVIFGGALGGDQQLLQQLSNNEIQMHIAGPVVVHHLLKEYQCLEAEYVYEDADHGMRVWTGPIGQEVNDKLKADYGITLLGFAPGGFRQLTSNKPIEKPSDLEGVKLRVTNKLRGEVFEAMGALPVPMAITEVYGALRQGAIDAQENPITTIWGDRFYEVQKDVNLTNHVLKMWTVSANEGFLESLSPEHQAIMEETLAESLQWLADTVDADERELRAEMEKTGVTFVDPDTAAFRELALPVVARYAEENCRPGLMDDIAGYAQP